MIDTFLVQSRKRNKSQSTLTRGGVIVEAEVRQVRLLILFALRLISTLSFVVLFTRFGMRCMFLSVTSPSLCFFPGTLTEYTSSGISL